VLSLTGTASLANYETALRSVSYNNTSGNPNTANRTISFVVNDGTANSTAATKTVSVTAVNDAPTLSPANTTVYYTEGGSPVAILNAATVSDAEDNNITEATIIINDFRIGDVLSVGTPGPYTPNYNGATGALTLTGTGTPAQMQTALKSITYSNTSDDPTFGGTDGSRNINIKVKDSQNAE